MQDDQTFLNLAELIKKSSGTRKSISSSTRLVEDLGIYGDDLDSLLGDYAEAYNVNMTDYIWYFHTGEEGFNPGGFFIKPPYKRVNRIPITVEMLQNFVHLKKWDVSYPAHTIPGKRWDISLSCLLYLCPLLLVLGLFIFN